MFKRHKEYDPLLAEETRWLTEREAQILLYGPDTRSGTVFSFVPVLDTYRAAVDPRGGRQPWVEEWIDWSAISWPFVPRHSVSVQYGEFHKNLQAFWDRLDDKVTSNGMPVLGRPESLGF